MRRSPLQSMLNSRLWVKRLGWIGWLFPVLLGGCIPAAASSLPSATFSETLPSVVGTSTAVPAIRAVAPSLITPTLPPTATQLPTPTLPPTPMPTPCAQDLCIFNGVFPFSRPIALPGTDTVEISYRFGSTANGTRDPHHGVEFLNAYGTPVQLKQSLAGGPVVLGFYRGRW